MKIRTLANGVMTLGWVATFASDAPYALGFGIIATAAFMILKATEWAMIEEAKEAAEYARLAAIDKANAELFEVLTINEAIAKRLK